MNSKNKSSRKPALGQFSLPIQFIKPDFLATKTHTYPRTHKTEKKNNNKNQNKNKIKRGSLTPRLVVLEVGTAVIISTALAYIDIF